MKEFATYCERLYYFPTGVMEWGDGNFIIALNIAGPYIVFNSFSLLVVQISLYVPWIILVKLRT